jgi:UDP-glucose/iron transport system ATP-binding protein
VLVVERLSLESLLILFEAQDLAFSSGPSRPEQAVSFSVSSGGCVWVTGPSGRGKSTLLRTIARLIPPVGGYMALDGAPWANVPSVQWRRQVIYLHQKVVLFPGTVKSNLEKPFGLRSRSKQRLDLEQTFSDAVRLLLPEDILGRDALTLSVGEASRVALLRSLAVHPKLLLLDEITAGLDPASRDATIALLQDWVKRVDRGIIGVTHDESVRTLLDGQEIPLGNDRGTSD